MNLINVGPVGLGHVMKADVAQEACIVDQDIDAAKGVHCRLDNLPPVDHGIGIGNCLTSGSLDFGHNLICRAHVGAVTLGRRTEIVDKYLGAARCQQQGVCTAKPTTCPGNNCNATIIA